MPEPVQDNNNPVTPPTGTDPKPPVNGDQNSQPDNQIPKHRFDEVNNKLKELQTWKEQQEAKAKADQEAALKEQKKFEELANLREKELNETKAQIQQQKIESAIERAAVKAGAVDSEAVLKLIDKSSITVDATTGNITGADEAVKSLLTQRPYLTGRYEYGLETI
jgi:hypothetical protein